MTFAPTEAHMWEDDRGEEILRPDDRAINERYARGEGRIIVETNREKLPGFVNQLKVQGYMDLRPFYQRRPRWDDKQKSLLIESFIMNIPVPPVFLYERDFNSFEVMDGQQRITSIKDFYNNDFKLKGLETWPELNGRTYSKLPDNIRAGIDRRSITSIVLLKESTASEEEVSSLRETVFERLNTGGVKLERQEIRNALYRGKFNDMIDSITRSDMFRDVWGIPRWVAGEIETNPAILENTMFSKMGDSEVVLRFFALRHADHYRKGMQPFLDIFMRKATTFGDEDISVLADLYTKSLGLAVTLYGDKVFRPWNPAAQEWDAKPHRAFQDAVMIGISRHLDQEAKLKAAPQRIIDGTKKLFEDNPSGAFTGRGNTKQDLIDRLARYDDMLVSVLA